MHRKPIRQSLAEQVAGHLREGLRLRQWADALPSERALSKELMVSRMTLRSALAMLEKEGLIRTDANRTRRIVHRLDRKRGVPKHVVFLTRSAEVRQGKMPQNMDIFQRIVDYLEGFGATWDLLYDAALREDDPSLDSVLERMVKECRADCWVLMSMRAYTLQWFSDRGLPTIAMGTVFPGIGIPHVDINHRAVCRHAVGLLTKRGHRRIGLLLGRQPHPESIEVLQGFREGMAAASLPTIDPIMIPIDNSADSVCESLDDTFASAAPPTALVLGGNQLTLTAVCHCLRIGKRIPRDLSLIARGNIELFNCVRPRLSRYAHNRHSHAIKIARLIKKMLVAGRLAPGARKLFPEWIEGETVGPAPPV